ncbi:hypothetical protein Bpfe_027566 [Biomphalaria pfeifferi]|uniref:Uncharacterized protein n=1 Tax=Biomphalaria pfeifferi TaxID=112525 RepID=A0AAD8AWH1_BIOPF|nr:hypothetical protein Bpfe_027566 [Biomphalaria pfeifferi]
MADTEDKAEGVTALFWIVLGGFVDEIIHTFTRSIPVIGFFAMIVSFCVYLEYRKQMSESQRLSFGSTSTSSADLD